MERKNCCHLDFHFTTQQSKISSERKSFLWKLVYFQCAKHGVILLFIVQLCWNVHWSNGIGIGGILEKYINVLYFYCI